MLASASSTGFRVICNSRSVYRPLSKAPPIRRHVATTPRPTIVLGLESSADDTCAAIVDSNRRIHSNVVLKQQDLYQQWGGIHPLHATSRHQNNMAKAIRQCLDGAKMEVSDVDVIAYTRGPGMPTCLAACALAAKTLSAAYRKPLIGVHHMQAHALTVGLTEEAAPEYPYLTLLVSGGHTLLLLARGPFEFEMLATTGDDSIGDAYDKVAKFLEVPSGNAASGGQAIEELVRSAPAPKYSFPVPASGQLLFSYSGLKSAVKRKIADRKLSLDEKTEIANAFQIAAVGQLEEKLGIALKQLKGQYLSGVVASGGVASNGYLRERLRKCLDANNRSEMRLLCPPVSLCTDNAAMIAWAALERHSRGMLDNFDSPIRAKWPIGECGEVCSRNTT